MLSNSDFEKLSVSQRKDYFNSLRNQCLLMKNSQLKIGQNIIKQVYPFIRGYKLELQGTENVPKDSNVIFLVNHSNSHDIFTAYEILSQLKRRGSVMVATDCLNPITTQVFNISNATLLDRRKAEDRNSSILSLSNKILNGNDGVIFGESTWNLHPIIPMHNVKQGVTKISAISQVPIIPTIFEYIEKDEIVDSEFQLYKKCIIRFGKPIMINYDDDFIKQAEKIKAEMVKMRNQIWSEYNINKSSIDRIDPLMYVNHTYLKKFKAFGFTYDSKKEQQFLLFLKNEPVENEYCITEEGIFCPGVTEKNFELKKLYK